MRGQEAGISCQIGLLCVRLKNTKINIEKETRKKCSSGDDLTVKTFENMIHK